MNNAAQTALDLEAWGRPTAEQAERHRLYGPRREVHPGDAIPEVPYAERTVRQVIFTFSKVNPAWAAEVQQRRTPEQLARLLGFLAYTWGHRLGDVLGLAEANRLEQALERIVIDSYAQDPEAVQNLTREQREVWFEWFEAVLALPVEDRWKSLPPGFDGANASEVGR